MTCEDCRWRTERNQCPWDYMYTDTNYAEDCMDFRYTKSPEDAFDEVAQEGGYHGKSKSNENVSHLPAL